MEEKTAKKVMLSGIQPSGDLTLGSYLGAIKNWSERAEIFRELDRMKIWYLPLKGIGLKSLYPGIGMREMSDNDILIDPCGRDRVHELMLRRGYTALSKPAEHHDVYLKQPIYNFEIHVGLIGDFLDKREDVL